VKKTSFLLFFILIDFVLYAQDPIALKYGNQISADSLKNYVFKLASKEFEGRETGKLGQKLAADYIAQHFKSSGCKPIVNNTYFQQIPLFEKKSTVSYLYINGKYYEFLKDFYFFPGFDDSLIQAGSFSFLGYGISDSLYDDFKNQQVKGKVLMVLSGEPMDAQGNYLVSGNKNQSEWSRRWRKKPDFMASLKPALVLIVLDSIQNNINSLRHSIESPTIQLSDKKTNEKKAVVLYISKQMADEMLISSGKSIEALKTKIQRNARSEFFENPMKIKFKVSHGTQMNTATNVLGFVEGSDSVLKKEIVVVTAHYDHLGKSDVTFFPGADDDASGTSAVMELARVFSLAAKQGNGLKRSILFMTVAGEEKGLLGSEYFTDHPIIPLNQFITDLNIDMIGRLDEKHASNENYVYIIGSNKLSKDLHQLSEETNRKYTNLDLDYTYNDPADPNRFYYRSDHYNFAKNNIPVIFYFNGVHQDYHKSSDTPEKILINKVKKISTLVFHTAWEIANRQQSIQLD